MPNALPDTSQEEGSKAKAEMQIRRLAEHRHHLLMLCPPMCVYSIPAVALKDVPTFRTSPRTIHRNYSLGSSDMKQMACPSLLSYQNYLLITQCPRALKCPISPIKSIGLH